MKNKIWGSALLAFVVSASAVMAQDKPDMPLTNAPGSKYQFTIVKDNGATPVKNQYHSGTCWDYSTQSFLESELLRMGKGDYDLSEMFVVYHRYLDKAWHYVRYMGLANFGEGGEPHDVINTVKKYGIVPASVYGLPAGMDRPELSDMDASLKAMLDAMLKAQVKEGHMNVNWFAAYKGALDGFMGVPPDKFTYKGKEYTPQSFAQSLGINYDDYVEITSFSHHPFYTKFALEIPDNIQNAEAYNVPLDELKQITDNAIMNGYTVEWGADVSEEGFNFKRSLAIVPVADMVPMDAKEKDSLFMHPVEQKIITQEMRQKAFDDLATTDDHGMQLTGMAKDQNGDVFYIVKNSWGTYRNFCKGYFYVSQPFYLYKTTSIMVNKNAIPADIRKKLGI